MDHLMPFVPKSLRTYPVATNALENAELVLLCNIRRWVAAVRLVADPGRVLSQAMDADGVAAAAMSIDLLMRVVARTAWHPVEIGCPHCTRLTADEQCLLYSARLAQERDTRMAKEALRTGMLSPIGASFAMGPLEGLGRIFAKAGLMLPFRSLAEVVNAPTEDITPWLPLLPTTLH